jgi:hypothetical protein
MGSITASNSPGNKTTWTSLRVIADDQSTPCAISATSMTNFACIDILSFLYHHLSDLLPTNTGPTNPANKFQTFQKHPHSSFQSMSSHLIPSHSITI